MKENLDYIMTVTTRLEGGYVNNKNDRGGPTNHGITQGTLSAHRGRPVSVSEVQALTKAEAIQILKKGYYDKVWGDRLPPGLDLSMTDFATNSGPSRANKELQKILGVAQDGIMGNDTMKAISLVDTYDLNEKLNAARMVFLKSLRGKTGWPTFGRGWTIRVTGVDPKGQWKKQPGIIDMSRDLIKKANLQISETRKPKVAAATPGMPDGLFIPDVADLVNHIGLVLPKIDFPLVVPKPIDAVIEAGKSSELDRGFTSTGTGKAIVTSVVAGGAAIAAEVLPRILDIAVNAPDLAVNLEPFRAWSPWVGFIIQILGVLGTVGAMFANRNKDRAPGQQW